VQSHSLETDRSSARQEISHIFCNPKVYYHIHKRLPPVTIMIQIKQPISPLHFLKILFNIIITSTPGSSKCSLSISFPHQNPVCTSTVSHTCHIPRPSLSFLFDHPRNIWRAVHIIKFLVMWSSPLPFYLMPLRFKYLSQQPVLEDPQPTFFSQCAAKSIC